jgi:hypothetical protein
MHVGFYLTYLEIVQTITEFSNEERYTSEGSLGCKESHVSVCWIRFKLHSNLLILECWRSVAATVGVMGALASAS